jgi:Tol biopolymer transport system component
MSDLRALLDRAAGNPPDLPDIDLIRQRGHVLRTRRRIRWGAGTVAASVLVAGLVLSVGQSDRDRLFVPARPSSTAPTQAQVTNACPTVDTPASGGIAYTLTRPGLTSAVHVMPDSGGAGRCLVDTPGADNGPAGSPDGQWVAFVGGDGIRDDVYIVREDGSGLRRVTDSPVGEAGPVWSPDGSRLAYTLDRGAGQPFSIHVVGLDGRSDEVVLRGPDAGVVAVQDWSPDGQTLLFTRDDTPEGGHIALWAMSPDGSGQRLLRAEVGDVGSAARYSPDGSQIAFQADLDGGCIYRSDPLAQRLTQVTTGCSRGGSLSWSPDGRRLALAGGDHGPEDAVVVGVDGSGLRTLTTGATVSHVDWRPASAE